MATVTMTVEEVIGDPDTDNVLLHAEKATLGGLVAGTPIGGLVVEPVPGLKFLILTAEAGTAPLPVEEIEGDVATTDVLIVIPKATVGALEAGDTIAFTEATATSGPVLYAQVV
jgi:hypothetical protein